MFGHSKARRLVLTAAAALTAALAFTAPAAASSRPAVSNQQAVISPSACGLGAAMDRDEHTGAVFATGFLTCPIHGVVSAMSVRLWIDSTVVRSRFMSCALGTNCFTSSGSSPLHAGRHRYCAEALFYNNGEDVSLIQWSCEDI